MVCISLSVLSNVHRQETEKLHCVHLCFFCVCFRGRGLLHQEFRSTGFSFLVVFPASHCADGVLELLQFHNLALMLSCVVLGKQFKEAKVFATQWTDEYIGACVFISEYFLSSRTRRAWQWSRIVLFLPTAGAGASILLLENMASSVHRSDALLDLQTRGPLRPLVQVVVPGQYQCRGGRTTKQDKVITVDSEFIFLIIQSQSQFRLVSAKKRWPLSGLVFARKVARMILIQNVQGPPMFNMAFIPLYMWEMWDVTPVTDTQTDSGKVVQYSVWAESAVCIQFQCMYVPSCKNAGFDKTKIPTNF